MNEEQLNVQLENNKELNRIKLTLVRFLKKWPWFISGVVLFVAITFFSLKFKPNIYQVETTVKIKSNNQFSDPNELLFGKALGRSIIKNHDEAVVLKSFPLIKQAVEKQELNISYYKEVQFGEREIFEDKPFTLSYKAPKSNDNYQFIFYLEVLEGSRFSLYREGKNESEAIDEEFEFGQEIPFRGFKFSFNRIDSVPISTGQKYRIHLKSIDLATYTYRSMIEIEEVNGVTNLITLKMKSASPDKAKEFLNTLVDSYVAQNLKLKNEVADNTIDFIDQQLKLISDSLSKRETSLESFKSNSKIADVSLEAEMLIGNYNEIEKDKARLRVMEDYYDYLLNNVDKNSPDNIIKLVTPSAFGITDETINSLVSKLVELNLNKQSLISQGKDQSPLLSQIDERIKNVKEAIYESIDELSEANKIMLANLNSRSKKLSESASRLPSSERQLVNLNRLLKLNENIYLFLMEKRSSAAIQRSSNTSDCEVIEPAMLSKLTPVGPNRKLSYIIAALLGLFVPIVIFALLDFLDDSLKSKDQLESLSDIPILGTIPKSTFKNDQLVVVNNPKSSLAESFRLIRANLSFVQKQKSPYVILITSSVPSEGKTFCSINLASVLAATGKKTALLGLDMRKPQLHNYLNIQNGNGISNYLIGAVKLEDIIQESSVENLSIITSGPNPPNPSELLLVENTKVFIEELKNKFDYIVMDSPPIGLVTDALVLNEYSDLSLFICREEFTKTSFLDNLNDIYKKNKNKDMGILYNHVKSSKRSKYSYGYYEDRNS